MCAKILSDFFSSILNFSDKIDHILLYFGLSIVNRIVGQHSHRISQSRYTDLKVINNIRYTDFRELFKAIFLVFFLIF